MEVDMPPKKLSDLKALPVPEDNIERLAKNIHQSMRAEGSQVTYEWVLAAVKAVHRPK